MPAPLCLLPSFTLMGSLIAGGLETASAQAGGFGLVGWVVGGAGVMLAAMLGGTSGNDDDDSTPGGGLMQPVAGAA